MIELDPLFLARVQFAFTISFHILFPAFTIGLASFLAMVEWRWLRTGDQHYKEIYKFWIKIFALAFGMGVVSGVVMSYQIGTNWSLFSDKTANVLGPLLGYEVLTAFFLESSFLGIMLFGWERVSRRMHFASTCIVAIGTLISAFWIIAANSWMQTPQGFSIASDGRLFPTSWLEIIFNPSFPLRFVHMMVGAFLTTSFAIGGVGAYYLLKNRFIPQAKIMLGMAAIMALFIAPLQAVLGDFHGLNTLKHQPIKVAAMEGIWETEQSAALRLFALPDQENERNSFEVTIPKLASLILTHQLEGEVKGLKAWAKEDRPPVAVVFWSFRVMVGIGLLMILTGLLSFIQYTRGKLFNSVWLQRWWVTMAPSGFVAILAGWFVTEVGRQPFVVFGVLRTSHAVSPAIIGPQVAWSLLTFIAMYSFMFGFGIYYLFKIIRQGIPSNNDTEQFYKHGMEATLVESTRPKGAPHV